MNDAEIPTISVHDDVPPDDGRLVDEGLGLSNDQAAPLHEVRRLSCFARLSSGTIAGGAVGRTWGECSELQQLWVAPALRRRGAAQRLELRRCVLDAAAPAASRAARDLRVLPPR